MREDSLLSKEVRKFLEWSTDYATAETLSDQTIKEIARQVSSGIQSADGFDDSELVLDFLSNRVDLELFTIIENDWVPEFGADKLWLELKKLPGFYDILEEVIGYEVTDEQVAGEMLRTAINKLHELSS